MKWNAFVLISTLMLAWVPGAYCETPAHHITVGIVPQQSPGELARLWTPVLKYLEEKSGLTLQFETAKDVATFDQRLKAGEYDIVYANPLVYTDVLHARLGYEAFAREKDRSLKGLIVVRKDSSYKTLSDLSGSELAFPSEAALAASILPRAYLGKQGVAFTPHYVGSHDSVFLAVAKGLYAGGGGVLRTFDMQSVQVKDQLKVLWTGPAYPPHPFAAHPRVPADAVKRLQAAMFSMDKDAAGQEVLKPIDFKGFMLARDADYDAIRALGYKLPGN
jgi:phosphonate transport system substrate-binding protein